ncbi:protein of unknown function (plasmid) [Shinella sp. WSC3-e]|nr:protein of unknown function [Shinella sp. WSC3-e]
MVCNALENRGFHKILKSGCKAEEARLRTAERLVKLIAVFCILAWRVFWMTMLNRTTPGAKPEMAITAVEMNLLDRLITGKPSSFEPWSGCCGRWSSGERRCARREHSRVRFQPFLLAFVSLPIR